MEFAFLHVGYFAVVLAYPLVGGYYVYHSRYGLVAFIIFLSASTGLFLYHWSRMVVRLQPKPGQPPWGVFFSGVSAGLAAVLLLVISLAVGFGAPAHWQ
jgi:hypothetical protein